MYEAWFDGSTHIGHHKSGIGWIIKHNGEIIKARSKQIPFQKHSAVAEYEALIDLLLTIEQMGIDDITIYGDCRVVIAQASGADYRVYGRYRGMVEDILGRLNNVRFKWVPRPNNRVADALSRSAY